MMTAPLENIIAHFETATAMTPELFEAAFVAAGGQTLFSYGDDNVTARMRLQALVSIEAWDEAALMIVARRFDACGFGVRGNSTVYAPDTPFAGLDVWEARIVLGPNSTDYDPFDDRLEEPDDVAELSECGPTIALALLHCMLEAIKAEQEMEAELEGLH